jgi:cell division protein FtsZ
MARKRASMREGPLADLFRSTEESVSEEEVRVTATKAPANGRQAEAEVATSEPDPAAEAQTGEQPAAEPQTGEEQAAAEPQIGEQRVVEPEARVETEPATDTDIEVEIRETHTVIERPAPQHEGLQRLLGGGEPVEERPAFGRDEPSGSRYVTLPRSHQAVLRVVGVGGAGVNAVNRMV